MRGAVAAVVTYSSCFLDTSFPLAVEKGCMGTRNPIGEAACLLGVLVVRFCAYVFGKTICKSFQREFTSWFVPILVAFDPAYVGCNGKVCYFMLDSL
jgi:hypothetical protein